MATSALWPKSTRIPSREVGKKPPALGDARRTVQCDRFPDAVDIPGRQTVPGQDFGCQIGAFDLEPLFAGCFGARAEVVHDAGGKEQVPVVGCVVQRTLVPGDEFGARALSGVLNELYRALPAPGANQAAVAVATPLLFIGAAV
jgi:hypothetical protein